MSDITTPRTPTPGSRGSKALNSPPPITSSDLTPPPSTQMPKQSGIYFRELNHHQTARLVSPPATTRPTPRARPEFKNGQFPTLEDVSGIPDSQCRDIVQELIPALGETRMALAHSKLQLNLLSIESVEAAQRAEAEHDLTRREVEVLQAGSPVLRNRASLYPDPRSPLAQVQRHLESSIKQGRGLEVENYQLQRRLKQAKKVIKHLDAKNTQLTEDNALLRDRIKQNRDHFNEIRSFAHQTTGNGSRPSTQSPQRNRNIPANSSRQRKQNPLDALLIADQLLSGEALSVPATPTPHRAARHNASHIRGTHSMSSLPTTPSRSRPATADQALRTPLNQIVPAPLPSYSAPAKQLGQLPSSRRREDRESTISVTDDEAMTDEDVPASQASQAASSMLRRFPGPSSQGSPRMGTQERLVQAKLLGKLSKPYGYGERTEMFREEEGSDGETEGRTRKKVRLDSGGREEVGLGIGLWPSPKR